MSSILSIVRTVSVAREMMDVLTNKGCNTFSSKISVTMACQMEEEEEEEEEKENASCSSTN